jgi:hypothetical protein
LERSIFLFGVDFLKIGGAKFLSQAVGFLCPCSFRASYIVLGWACLRVITIDGLIFGFSYGRWFEQPNGIESEGLWENTGMLCAKFQQHGAKV